MLVVSNISKRFRGAETHILKDITFTVNGGERVGLIGPNGSGKSTLLQIITGQVAANAGSIQYTPPDLRVGYLAQGITADDNTPVKEILFPQMQALHDAENEVEQLSAVIATGNSEAIAAYDVALQRLVRLSSIVDNGARERTLHRLGLSDVDLDAPVCTLSGGQKTRLMLASLLIGEPQLLLLDEPTNHLDVVALEWLEQWLNDFSGGVLIVSHDRVFLDRVSNRIVAIDPLTANARVHVGNYSDYLATIRYEREKQWAQWKDQEDEIARLKHDASRTMARAVRKENATNNDHQRRLAKKVAHKAKAKEKRLERYLDADERVEKPKRTWDVRMEFGEIGHIRGAAVRLEAVTIGYDPAVPLLENLDLSFHGKERIAIMGPNGHGKSTLLKTVIGQLPPLQGNVFIGGSVQVGYLAQEQDILNPQLTALDTIRAEAAMTVGEARYLLHRFLFKGDDTSRQIGELSYGERTRLMLARLVANGANLLVMDEPLNHLDLSSREKFEQALINFPGSILAVVHDRHFVDLFAGQVWNIENGRLNVEFCTPHASYG